MGSFNNEIINILPGLVWLQRSKDELRAAEGSRTCSGGGGGGGGGGWRHFCFVFQLNEETNMS